MRSSSKSHGSQWKIPDITYLLSIHIHIPLTYPVPGTVLGQGHESFKVLALELYLVQQQRQIVCKQL